MRVFLARLSPAWPKARVLGRCAILALGFALAAAGSAAVYAIPDDSAALIAAQAVVGGVSVVGFGAALTGSNLLRKLQAD